MRKGGCLCICSYVILMWMVAIPSPALGFDKEGSSKGEVSCVFQGSSPVSGLPWRSPSARMETAGALRGWQGRACPTRQPGSRAGQGQPGSARDPDHSLAHGRCWAKVKLRRQRVRQGPEQADPRLLYNPLPALLRQGLKPTLGSWALGRVRKRTLRRHIWVMRSYVCLDAMWPHRTAIKLQTYKTKSTQALPLAPKAPDQVLNIFSLLVYFLGLVLQSMQLPNCSHLKRMSPNVKIT